LSLFRRLLGIGLTMLAGLMIGYVQGLQSIVDAVSNIAIQVGPTLPNSSPFEAAFIAAVFSQYAEGDLNPAYASFWAFGILLTVGGFILIARGGRKPKAVKPEPLLLPPMPENQQR
jgi:hypothetical protein